MGPLRRFDLMMKAPQADILHETIIEYEVKYKRWLFCRMSVVQATDWLFKHEADDDIDTPLPGMEEAALPSKEEVRHHYQFGKSVHSWCDGSSDRSFMVDPLSYFSFQPVLHNWCNKGCGICYPVCGMVHIKEPLLLIGKSSPCGSNRFPLSLSE